jgi:CRP-like cAMP-binding protein
LFWGLAFFQEQALMPVTLEARQACQLYLWSRERLLPILRTHTHMMWALCQLMVTQMLRASAIVDQQTFCPVDARLARMLLDSFEMSGEAPVVRSMTLDEMAARIGTTSEMVCRTLYRFADINLILVTRTELSLADKEGLSELATTE